MPMGSILRVIAKAAAGIGRRRGWPLTCVKSCSREDSGRDSGEFGDLALQCRVVLVVLNCLALLTGLVLATNSGFNLLGRDEYEW